MTRDTKERIASSFEELLLEKPFVSISVRDIAGAGKLSRNTFYYHFSDKYELMGWIMRRDLMQYVPHYEDPQFLADTFLSVCRMMCARRYFYYPCFQYEGQNSLFEFFIELYYGLWVGSISKSSRKNGAKSDDLRSKLFARMNAHALVGLMRDWIQNGMCPGDISRFCEVKGVISTLNHFGPLISGKPSEIFCGLEETGYKAVII